ncbi:hypothetical protein [Nesterenkonia halobia]|uniref:Fibronectin type-III domain-containing protein n=1 Tax=Nesterenkonia halobia TaxID=37922 RepID=A0ABP6RFN9_9MICC
MTRRRGSRPRLRRLRAGVAVTGALALLVSVGAPQPPTDPPSVRAPVEATLAEWTAGVHARADALTASTVNPPAPVECRPRLLQRPLIVWTPPASGPEPEGYAVEIRRRGVLSPEGLISSETYGPGTTQVSLSADLLEVLEDLLGISTRYSITVRTLGPGQWTSEPSQTANFSVTLGLVPSCA